MSILLLVFNPVINSLEVVLTLYYYITTNVLLLYYFTTNPFMTGLQTSSSIHTLLLRVINSLKVVLILTQFLTQFFSHMKSCSKLSKSALTRIQFCAHIKSHTRLYILQTTVYSLYCWRVLFILHYIFLK